MIKKWSNPDYQFQTGEKKKHIKLDMIHHHEIDQALMILCH